MANSGSSVPRRSGGAQGHAAIRLRTIEVIFQRYPGIDADSAIQGLEYEVAVGRATTRGTTGADGKVTIRVPTGAVAVLTAMGTRYELSASGALDPPAAIKGMQQRLNLLGYGAGAVDGSVGPQTEYALLNYQADNAPLKVNGLPTADTGDNLRDKVGE